MLSVLLSFAFVLFRKLSHKNTYIYRSNPTPATARKSQLGIMRESAGARIKKSKIQSVHTRDVTGSHFYDPDRPIPITTDP